MAEKLTERFLNSIGLNQDDYDLDLLSCTKSTMDRNLFVFQFSKETPWEAKELSLFLDALNEIRTYKYEMNFSYKTEITGEDAIEIIKDKYFSLASNYLNVDFEINFSDIIFKFKNIEEKEEFDKNIQDLQGFLKFINYNFFLKSEFFEEIKLEKNEELDLKNEIKESDSKGTEIAVDDYIKNLELMKEERMHKDAFIRGDYNFIEIKDIDTNSGSVDFNGYVFEKTERDTRKGGKSVRLGVADENTTAAIYVSIYSNKSTLSIDKLNEIKLGSNIRIKGKIDLDRNAKKDPIVVCHYFYLLPPNPLREDTSEEKRVELHLHTKMSEMDGVATIDDYCKLAKHMGHKAIAVTDHGCVQAFPEAQAAAKKYGLKMLYGCEIYLIDDYLRVAKNPTNRNLTDCTYVCFDLETTGLSIKYDRITEFGAVKIKNGFVIDRLDILINPEKEIPHDIEVKTNITNEMVKDKPTINEVLPEILEFFGDAIVVSHNIEFDYGMLKEAIKRRGFGTFEYPAIDTLALSRYVYPENVSHSLGSLCKRLEVAYDEDSAHRADYDAQVLASCWISLLGMLLKKDKNLTHSSLAELEIDKLSLKHMRGNHAIVLARNAAGLKDLYKIVSYSHVDYMGAHPFVPKHVLNELRSNLLVGTACFNSEVFYASTNRSMEDLEEVMKMYDYVEIQPLENYRWLLDMKQIPSEDLLKQYIMDIISVAEKQEKLIVATGDCHYLDPKDKKFRDVYIANKAVGNINHPLMTYARIRMQEDKDIFFDNPDQHFRSTDEMLKCFEWLGKRKSYEYVITNTNKIANFCEVIQPIPDGLFNPKIENSDKLLRELCYKNTEKIYGDVFNSTDPAKIFIKERLEKELDGIISNGYAVIYYIAHKLVKKSNEDGYLVGSRGSVGSSFAATMAEITEVNPLPPHYHCPKCKHVEFSTDENIKSGYDLPVKKCPDCGEIMISDGQNIPFQTFLGFQAEKVPDIDLNFPTDYQATAHQYTKVLLGENNVYRAGTISTVQFKTAYGYARKYFEMQKINPDSVKGSLLAAIAYNCQEVKRTTGQHPGGIVVIPNDHDVYDFTPVQYPAGDVDAAWKTTHFDFHSIHDTVLKLDMLGHVDPQALKMMGDLTGIDCRTLPFNDKKVLSLFSSDDALKLQHKYMEPDNGAIAMPEFGTNFVRQMLRETNPKSFSDLLIISGLSHGTNVWTNNAQDLVSSGTTDLRGVIGCRDDIMSFLISKGLEGHDAFVIMEAVRKGKKLKDEQVQLMREHDVPEYYIQSCNKIAYLFPKGHACAYVMMALRVGYYKVYYPLEFYATFFTLRADQYDIKSMVGGIDAIHKKLVEFDERRKTNNPEFALSKKEEDQEATLIVALEMCERGFKFENIDIEKSDGINFIVDKENNALIPPFKVIDGFGEKAAEVLIEARKERKFISKEDLSTRGKVSATQMKILEDLHVLDGLRDNNQMSLFDFSF